MFDGSLLTMYADGAPPLVYSPSMQGAMAAPAAVYPGDAIRIGCEHDFGADLYYFIGTLDEVRLYDRPLSATEIASLAQ